MGTEKKCAEMGRNVSPDTERATRTDTGTDTRAGAGTDADTDIEVSR